MTSNLAKGDKARIKNPDSCLDGSLVEVIEVLDPEKGPDYKVLLLEAPPDPRSIWEKGERVHASDHELEKA
jgi:hypothetical protein